MGEKEVMGRVVNYLKLLMHNGSQSHSLKVKRERSTKRDEKPPKPMKPPCGFPSYTRLPPLKSNV